VKPLAPYAWLAAHIRAGDAAPATTTTPAFITTAAAAEFGATLAKAWGYCSEFRGVGAGLASDTVAPAASSSKAAVGNAKGCGEVALSIDAAESNGVLLVIR